MNQDVFKKAQKIQEQLEFFKKARDSISKKIQRFGYLGVRVITLVNQLNGISG